MRYEMQEVRIGEDVGPVDWDHQTAAGMPSIWRDAERDPSKFLIDYGHGGREIIRVCMYDGWPYWEPRPAVQYVGPLGRGEWVFFDSYGVHKNSITPKHSS